MIIINMTFTINMQLNMLINLMISLVICVTRCRSYLMRCFQDWWGHITWMKLFRSLPSNFNIFFQTEYISQRVWVSPVTLIRGMKIMLTFRPYSAMGLKCFWHLCIPGAHTCNDFRWHAMRWRWQYGGVLGCKPSNGFHYVCVREDGSVVPVCFWSATDVLRHWVGLPSSAACVSSGIADATHLYDALARLFTGFRCGVRHTGMGRNLSLLLELDLGCCAVLCRCRFGSWCRFARRFGSSCAFWVPGWKAAWRKRRSCCCHCAPLL